MTVTVIKRSGDREPFDRGKVERGVRSATKNRPVDDDAIAAVAVAVEETMRLLGRDVSSEEVGVATLEELRHVDDVSYVRFASVYKGFETSEDFAQEIRNLEKTTAPKSRK